jgi:hypothetical protein
MCLLWSYGLDTMWSLHAVLTGCFHFHSCMGHFQLEGGRDRLSETTLLSFQFEGVWRITVGIIDILGIVCSLTVTETLSFQTVRNDLSVPIRSLHEDRDWSILWKSVVLIAWYIGQCPECSHVYQTKTPQSTWNITLNICVWNLYNFVNLRSTFWYINYIILHEIGGNTISYVL